MASISLESKLIASLFDISLEAGKAIMKEYNTDFEIETKKDSSPLTRADKLSNDVICSELKKITPDIPILSEESSQISFNIRSQWKEYWLIDPMDGTKEFIKKNDEFTTNIALINGNRPVFGMIHAPAINQTFWGGKKIGSFYLEGEKISKKREINASKSVSSCLRVASSRSHSSNLEEDFFMRAGDHEVTNIGSSLKFCKVANGEVDIYPRFGPTSEWDTAAGDAIVTFAGGYILTASGQQLRYNDGESLINPSFLVARNKKLSNKYLSLMNNNNGKVL